MTDDLHPHRYDPRTGLVMYRPKHAFEVDGIRYSPHRPGTQIRSMIEIVRDGYPDDDEAHWDPGAPMPGEHHPGDDCER